MKKIVVFIVLSCVLTGSVFAQRYTVQSVTGRVQREAGSGRVEVKAGDILAADAVIFTGVGASLVLNDGERTFTAPAARNGKVGELVSTASAVRVTGNVTHVETGTVSRTTAQVNTASARSADAAADDDIAAE